MTTADKYAGRLEMGCYESLAALQMASAYSYGYLPINGDSRCWDSIDRWLYGQCPIFALALYDVLEYEGWELCVDADDYGLFHAFVIHGDAALMADAGGVQELQWENFRADGGCRRYRYGDEAAEYLRYALGEGGTLFPQVYDEETRTRIFEIAQECREEVSI